MHETRAAALAETRSAGALAPRHSLAPRSARSAGFLGLGVALPEPVLSNRQVAARIGVDEEWILRRTGISERRQAPPGSHLSELASAAGQAALTDAEVDARELDLVVLASFTAEAVVPPVSARIAHLLGADGAATVDINNACTGFVSALAIADALIGVAAADRALVIGAEIISRHVDPDDRTTAAVFGDGAGAAVIAAGARGRVGPCVMGADGAQAHLITVDPSSGLLRMDGHETFKHAVSRLGEVALQACASAGVELGEVDLFVFHQANSRITRSLTARLGVDPAKVVDCIAAIGNTSAASIPLALEHARRDGRLNDGAVVLLAAFGAGLTWGATVLEW